ncbi:MAG: sulfatase-like hydrolase/transferase [Verrucomicrobia bacterium]|nr:sulfatase-like hydrolase/transferase [Verrucomicrobiota bacterium]
MTANRQRIAKTGLILAIVLAPVLGYLLWPIRTDHTIMQPDPALLPGKQSYLANTKANPGAPHPNVVVLLADDLGEFDISLYGGKEVPTPHIDSLARSGVTFTDGYCTSPICSPSRAGLLTGRYQQRFGHELQPGDGYPGSRLEILLGNRLVFTERPGAASI